MSKIDLSNTKVKVIDEGAFYDVTTVIEIKLPNTLEVINTDAFCHNAITLIEIPYSVIEINGSFTWCNLLETVIFKQNPDNPRDERLKKINNAFKECYSLIDIHCEIYNDNSLPSLVVKMENAFYECRSLKKLDLFDLRYMEKLIDYAFWKCQELSDIILPQNLKIISVGCFAETMITNLELIETKLKK